MVQNTRWVSIGGQPGTLQAISDTMTVSSSVSAKRVRAQSRTRSAAAPFPGLFLLKPSIATYTISDLIPQQVTETAMAGERSDAVLWTAMSGHDEKTTKRSESG